MSLSRSASPCRTVTEILPLPRVRRHLAGHASTAASVPGLPGGSLYLAVDAADNRDQGRIRHHSGVGRVEPLHLAQEDEQLGVHNVRDHRRQTVIIAEYIPFDLLHRHHVVIVHDRHCAYGQQRLERVAHVEIPQAALKIAPRYEGLPDNDAVSFK
jgi:hypothetical protein